MNQVKKSALFLGLIISLIAQTAFGQTPKLDPEQVSFSIPKNIYFGGERIWIKAEAFADGIPAPSQIIYAELVNRYNESVAIAKMPLTDGAAFNFLRIPANLPSDHYLLRVFTRISPYLDLESGLVQQYVTIFNSAVPPEVVASRKTINSAEPKDNLISISTNQVKAGETIEITLNQEVRDLELAVSVSNPFLENQSIILSSEIYQGVAPRTLVPELFGHIVEAKLDQENPDAEQLYYLSVHGAKSALFTDRPDENGSLFFDAGGMKNWRFMVAQANNNKSLLDLSIVSPAPKTEFKAGFTFPFLTISPADQAYLQELLRGGQIEGYFVQEFDSSPFPVVTGFVEDQTYNLDDYTRFESVEVVIKEYVPEVGVKTVQKRKEYRVLDKVRGAIFDDNPLMLVDAMPVFDSDLLAAFNPKGLQKLEVLTRNFYLNEEVFPGVISFSSYNNNFGGFPIPTNGMYLDYQGILPKVLESENLFAAVDSDSRILDWRTVLFWSETANSNLTSNKVTLKAPATKGKFRVRLDYLDSNGKKQTTFKYFEVN
ncbi:hypothetical protein [Algoriphagus marinus]|uniref:hypothetical protein n=1 Tax=Algoriphagus marinus TaxID=1925762 RepID=UPI00094B9E70|nr:hypothetical protein [Algoriphagus marinus]